MRRIDGDSTGVATASHFASVLLRELQPSPSRILTAAKGAVAAVIAMWIADRLGIENPFFVLIAVVMMNQGNVGGSLETIVSWVFGAILGMVIAMIPVIFFQEMRVLYLVFFIVFIAVGAMGTAGSAASMSFLLATVFGAVIGYLGILSPSTVTTYFGWQSLAVLIAGAVLWGVQVLFFPAYAVQDFQSRIKATCEDLASALRSRVDPAHRVEGNAALHRIAQQSGKTIETLLALSRQADLEGWDSENTVLWRQKALGQFEKLLIFAGALTRTESIPPDHTASRELLQSINGVLLRCAEVLQTVALKPDTALPRGFLHEAVAEVQQTYEKICDEGSMRELPDEQVWALTGGMEAVSSFAHLLEAIQQSLREVAVKTPKPDFICSHWFATSPMAIHFAIRLVVAIFTTGWLMLELNWDNGTTALISVGIITQTTLGRSYRKMTQRLIGCFIGGLAAAGAVVFVIPYLSVFWQMGLVLGVLMFASCYVSAGGPRYSYVGLQSALIIALLLVPDQSQPSGLGPLWTRVTGILLSCGVAILVSKLVFPVTSSEKIWQLIRDRVHLLGAHLATHLSPGIEGPGRSDVVRLTHALSELDQLLLEAGCENGGRSTPERISKLSAAVDAATCAALAIPGVDTTRYPAEWMEKVRPALESLGTSIRQMETGNGEGIRQALIDLDARMHEIRSTHWLPIQSIEIVRSFIGWIGLIRETAGRCAEVADQWESTERPLVSPHLREAKA